MLKGYQGWAGRCLVGINALFRARDLLDGYTLYIFSNPGSDDVVIASRLLESESGINVRFLPVNTSHEDIKKEFEKLGLKARETKPKQKTQKPVKKLRKEKSQKEEKKKAKPVDARKKQGKKEESLEDKAVLEEKKETKTSKSKIENKKSK